MINIQNYFTDFDRGILERLGIEDLPNDYNPVTRALKDNPNFVIDMQINKRQKSAVSRLAILCQINVFDHSGGPDGDGKPKGLRRHWYTYFKTSFAQPFSRQMGEDLQHKDWTPNWAGRLSVVCADLVRDTDLTYKKLWVSAISRVMDTTNQRIAEGCHIIVVVEKNSLFDDFQNAAIRLGARALYSTMGKSALAAIEKLLRDSFGWDENYNPFSDDNPLYIIHISDYDYDGKAVIGPTVGEQCRVFTDHVLEARVGVEPQQVEDAGYDLTDKRYEIKLSNCASKKWAIENAIEGIYGFEVEAMKTSDYYELLVDAFLRLKGFNSLVKQMRNECRPSENEAVEIAQRRFLWRQNDDYVKLKRALWRYEDKIEKLLQDNVGQHVADVLESDVSVTAEDYKDHVAGSEELPWRPFKIEEQNEILADILIETYTDDLLALESDF